MFNRLVLHSMLSATLLVLYFSSNASGGEAFTLANGLRVRLVSEHDPGNISMFLAVRAGILHEGKHEGHLAHVTEHATVYDLGEAELAETVKQWFREGKANAETLGEFMYFDLRCTRAELSRGLAIQASRLDNMNYSAATLEREIPRALAEVDHLSRQPGGLGKFALVPFVQAAFYRETDVPLRQQTKEIGVDAVRTFHDRTFRVQSATLVVVGDFDAAQARQEIEQRFGSLGKNNTATPTRPALTPSNRRVRWDVPKRHWFVAWQTPKVSEADYPAMWLAERLLQQRLFESASRAGVPGQLLVNTDLDQMLLIGCDVQDEHGFDVARKVVLSEIERMGRTGGINPVALRLCCDQLDGFYKTNLDQVPLPPGVTRTMARTNMELQRLTVEMLAGDWQQFLPKLKTASSGSVESAIREWLSADRACFVEIAPKSEK